MYSPAAEEPRWEDLAELPASEYEAACVVETEGAETTPTGEEAGHRDETGPSADELQAISDLSSIDPQPADVASAIDEQVPAASSEGGTADLPGSSETSAEFEPPLGALPSGPAPDGSGVGARSDDASRASGGREASAIREASPVTSRPIDRSPRRRKPPRDRVGGARRNDPPRRSRPDGDPSVSSGDPEEAPAPSILEVELPSVRDILANHCNSPGPRPAVERPRKGKQAVPTVPQEPGHWVLPGWLALPPVAICVFGMGLAACTMSWWWARDASNASVITQRLLAAEGSGRRRPLPEDLAQSGGGWIRTTAQHLAHRGVYLTVQEEDEAHPAGVGPSLLSQALAISPLNPTARLAMAQIEEPGRDGRGRIRGLGLSRDSVSLAWSARRLMDSGKKAAALRLYTRALSAAVDGGLSRSATPRFSDDPSVHRYFLPAEDAIRDIVAELASRDGLEFREWSGALPRNPVVLLATARLLHEQGRTEADGLLDELLGAGGAGPEGGRGDPRRMAARAEALMLKSRSAEAVEHYRQAIESVDNDLIRRSWWFNLADIVNDEGQRQAAIRAALAVASSDDITRRASLIQKSGVTKSRSRYGFGSIKAQ
jgi:hypothetical protein